MDKRLLITSHVLLALLVLPTSAEETAAPSATDALASYIATAREAWEVPGVAVGIVKDGKVLMSRGFGTLAVDDERPVDGETLFAIASNTKAFTAAALAVLVDEGKLSWDDPVRKHLPYFELYDRYVTDEMTVRDLLCHRSGLGTFSGDLLWYGTPYSAEEVVRRARHLQPAGPFRASYGYSNLMYLAAGEVVAAVSGKSWQAFVDERFLQPLGMKRSQLSVTQLDGLQNVATPHKPRLEEVVKVPWINWDGMAAAGGIISCTDDMNQWLLAQLKHGVHDGQRIFSDKNCHEMRKPHTPMRVSADYQRQYPSTHFRAYGLGWGLRDYKGHLIISHGGGYDGMYSRVVLVPELDLGVVVLTNSMTSLPTAITNRVLDQFLGGEPRDWSGEMLPAFRQDRENFYQRIASQVTPVTTDSQPSKPLEAFVGSYQDAMYGEATIALEEDRLVLRLVPFPALVADLEHLHYDTFVVRWRNQFAWFEEGTCTFSLDDAGRVTSFVMQVPNDDLWFHELDFRRE
ncbi:MAG: serine hydrolase [Planctomycetota bacterium]